MKKIKLYHYLHCPYCVRVRMALGYLKVPYESIILSYEDEKTPVSITGKKMLPIVTDYDGKSLNESLDIIRKYDLQNSLIDKNNELGKMESLADKLGKNVHPLCMPYWIYTKEFSETSRNYFQQKKEKTKGPFTQLVKNRPGFETLLNKDLQEIEKNLSPFYLSEVMTISDIIIAAHLWGLYVLPEFQFTEKMHFYLQRIKELCNFSYYENLWD